MKFHGIVEAYVKIRLEIEAPDIDTADICLKRKVKEDLAGIEGTTKIVLEHVSIGS